MEGEVALSGVLAMVEMELRQLVKVATSAAAAVGTIHLIPEPTAVAPMVELLVEVVVVGPAAVPITTITRTMVRILSTSSKTLVRRIAMDLVDPDSYLVLHVDGALGALSSNTILSSFGRR
jgi:hypothetical protein